MTGLTAAGFFFTDFLRVKPASSTVILMATKLMILLFRGGSLLPGYGDAPCSVTTHGMLLLCEFSNFRLFLCLVTGHFAHRGWGGVLWWQL